MRNAAFIGLLFALIIVTSSQLSADVVLIDFGRNDVTNGNVTTSPDSNGNYWNNFASDDFGTFGGIASGASISGLIDTSNNSTSIGLETTSTLSANGILNGGLLAPSGGLLGDFAIATATQDYVFTTSTGGLRLTGLDPSMFYSFRLFGTRETAITRETQYEITGGNGTFTQNLITSGTDIGNDGMYDGNDDTIVSILGVTPDVSNQIDIDLSVVQGGFAYLGVMEVTSQPVPEPSSIALCAAAFLLMVFFGRRSKNDAEPLPARQTIR